MHELALHHIPGENGSESRIRVEYRPDEHSQPQSAEASFQFEYDPEDRRRVQWYLEEYFICPWGPYRQLAVEAEQKIRTIGEQLFSAVFSNDELKDLYRNIRNSLPSTRFVVHATSTAGASLPWEFLHDAKLDALGALARQAHSFIRSRPNVVLPSVRPSGKGPLNILLVICRPSGPDKDVPFQSVARPLVDMFNRDEMRDRVNLTVLRPPTFQTLAQDLLDNPGKYHVVHFDGHGTFPNVPGGLSGAAF